MNIEDTRPRNMPIAVAKLIVGVVSALGVTTPLAAQYAEPPSWDPMLMLRVSFDSHRNLQVAATSTIIRLQPAPGCYDPATRSYDLHKISFDPEKAWAVLNATAYSRVLGWYDEGTTGANGDNFYDTFARELAGNYVWIEKTGGSPELETYAVTEAGDPTEPYTPIFGTAGSPARWCWDGFMAHNVYAVPLSKLATSNRIFTATYDLYVGDAAGNRVEGYGGTTTTWTWQGPAVPCTPRIGIRNSVAIQWPLGPEDYVIEMADSNTPPNWMAVTNLPLVWEGANVVLLDRLAAGRQVRLRRVP